MKFPSSVTLGIFDKEQATGNEDERKNGVTMFRERCEFWVEEVPLFEKMNNTLQEDLTLCPGLSLLWYCPHWHHDYRLLSEKQNWIKKWLSLISFWDSVSEETSPKTALWHWGL